MPTPEARENCPKCWVDQFTGVELRRRRDGAEWQKIRISRSAGIDWMPNGISVRTKPQKSKTPCSSCWGGFLYRSLAVTYFGYGITLIFADAKLNVSLRRNKRLTPRVVTTFK